jgi:hypothetical protein
LYHGFRYHMSRGGKQFHIAHWYSGGPSFLRKRTLLSIVRRLLL